MESEIVKKVFLNRIEDSYVQQQQSKNEVNDSSIEKSNAASSDETFKNNFLDLVNSLLSNGATQQPVNSEKVKTKPKELNILKGRRVRKYDNENILSSSVFEMEELEELGSNEHFVSDEDASNEEETTTTTTGLEDNSNMLENIKKNVLKKRNSNVDEDLNNPIEKSGHFSIGINKKYNKDLLSNKYSCSLPRDIPVMHHGSRMSTIKNIVNQSSEEENRADNENQYFNNNEKVDHQKRHKSRVNMTTVNNRQIQSMSTSYKNQNDDESESSPNNNNDLYEGDDELFEDDHNNNLTKTDRLDDDGDDETNTKNMGQAISNLASSIVLKDGRELFGGVPSRRVPINSISKSCFE